jgi:hypothetical protein
VRAGRSHPPIAVDCDEVDRLEVDLGSLYPAEVGARRTRFEVPLDGRKVWSASGAFHPAATENPEPPR